MRPFFFGSPLSYRAVFVAPNGIFPLVRGLVFFQHQQFVYFYAKSGLCGHFNASVFKHKILFV